MITVIIPTYKTNAYFSDCLVSLKKQTINKTNFEIIVILNGEKEPYFSEINHYIKKIALDNIRVLYTEEKGVSNARNIGLDHAKGDYIVFLDDDDFLSEFYLFDLYSRMKEKGDENTIVASNLKTINKNGTIGNDYLTKAYDSCMNKNYSLLKYRHFLSTSCAKIIPALLINNYRFDHTLSISEDAVFMFGISKNIKKIILSDGDSIYYRRIIPTSAQRRKRSFMMNLKNLYRSLRGYSKIYFSDRSNYKLLLYLSRVAAASLLFIKNIKK